MQHLDRRIGRRQLGRHATHGDAARIVAAYRQLDAAIRMEAEKIARGDRQQYWGLRSRPRPRESDLVTAPVDCEPEATLRVRGDRHYLHTTHRQLVIEHLVSCTRLVERRGRN